MSEVNVNCIKVGMLATNCYLVYDDERKEVIITDPGDNAVFIEQAITQLGLKPIAIFLTHAHYDHIMGVPRLKETYKIPIYIHEDDIPLLENPEYNMGVNTVHLAEDDIILKGGEELEIGGMNIQVIHTPGHTPGSVSYYFPVAKMVLSGDTMFRFSWGRTDFWGGDEDKLMHSLYEKLLMLPEEVAVFPGHEAATSIKDERKFHESMYGRR